MGKRSYNKPDFYTPAFQVESTLPGSIYGRTNGTKVAAALLAGSLTQLSNQIQNYPGKKYLKLLNKADFLNTIKTQFLRFIVHLFWPEMEPKSVSK